MKKQGIVVKWDSDKSFGLIRSPDTPTDIFFHRRDYDENRSPFEGLAVTFQEIHVGGKGPRALSVAPTPNAIVAVTRGVAAEDFASLLPRSKRTPRTTPMHERKREARRYWSALGLMGFWLLLWLIGIGLGRFAWIVLPALALLNLATFYVYWHDKEAAVQHSWRASENQLHGLALFGGWPGAWFAQQILNHKSGKKPFQARYRATVVFNLLGLIGWLVWPTLLGLPVLNA